MATIGNWNDEAKRVPLDAVVERRIQNLELSINRNRCVGTREVYPAAIDDEALELRQCCGLPGAARDGV